MKWSKLLNIENGNQVIAAPRIFGNWHSKRSRLERTGRLVATHRISAKRVLFEIYRAEGQRLQNQTWRWLGLALSAISLVVASFAIFGEIPMNQAIDATSKIEEKSVCLPLSLPAETVDNLKQFDSGAWKLSTSAPNQQIGAVQEFDFLAECAEIQITGKIQAFENSGRWTILKMTPAQ